MPVLNSEDESSEAEGASEEEDGSSSSGSDSGSDSDCGGRMLKPVFVPRKDRVTIHEQEAKARAEEAKMEEQRRAQEQKKESTRVLVAESMRRIADEEAQVDDADEDAGLPDDTDSVDPALEVRRCTETTRPLIDQHHAAYISS